MKDYRGILHLIKAHLSYNKQVYAGFAYFDRQHDEQQQKEGDAITLNAAKIMGVADKAGSIEVGKEANIIISTGDILDMSTSNATDAFI